MKTFVFPGQGSQSKGMGSDLFEKFSDLTAKADQILGYSIKQLCVDDPNNELNRTEFTQPALYVVNALSYYKKVKETGQAPDYVAGHSLGELNALLAADCFDFETGLRLVKKRGELMSQVTSGGMAAILNASKEEIEKTLADNDLNSIDLANFNAYSQIVISGSREDIKKAETLFKHEDQQFHYLNAGGAFHSRYMQSVREEFESYLNEFTFSESVIPVISNVTAMPYENHELLKNISEQITNCVRWVDSIRYLINVGEESGNPMEFEEIGHGNVLTKIIAKIQQEIGDQMQANTTVNENKSRKPNYTEDAEKKVVEWNKKYCVGTKVKSTVMDYNNLETRTEAVVLFGHRAAVYMKDYNGYFDLDEIEPV